MSARKQKQEEASNSDNYSDVDFDLDLESVPVQKGAQEAELENDLAEGAAAPDIDDSDDDEHPRNDGNKFGVIYDLLLTQEQMYEQKDEWDFKGFIKEFADEEIAAGITEDLVDGAAMGFNIDMDSD